MGDCKKEHAHSHGHGDGGGHGHSHGEEYDATDPSGITLFPYIYKDGVMCLNEARTGMAKHIIKSWDQRAVLEPHLESEEDDAEIIITIPFICAVNVKSFCVGAYKKNRAPNKVKIFANRDDIDFDLAKDLKATQEYDLIEDFESGVDYPLVPMKFKGITSITFFFPSNFLGAEETSMISYLGLKGDGTEVRRGVVKTTYEASAQMKDHKKIEGSDNAQSYLS